MLTRKQLEQFYEDGFLVVPGLIPTDERQNLLDALERVMDKVNREPERYRTRYTVREGERWDTWGVGDVFCPELYEPAFNRYLGNERLLAFIAGILGRDMRFWGGHALWSPRSVGYNLRWHRDGAPWIYDSTGRTTHVQLNSALQQDHCFIAVPGSHRRALTEAEWMEVQSGGTADLPGQVIACCEPGDVLLMNAWTLHRGRSEAGGSRRTLHFNLQPKQEWYGGHSSRSWMRDPKYLDQLHPNVRKLMENLVEWDDKHPLLPESNVTNY